MEDEPTIYAVHYSPIFLPDLRDVDYYLAGKMWEMERRGREERRGRREGRKDFGEND